MSSCGLTAAVVAQRLAEELQGPIGEHLVDVHVRRRARPALQGIDDHVLVEPARDHLFAGGLNGGELRFVGPAELVVRPRRRQLDRAEAMHQAAMHRPPGEREILDRPQRMDAPEDVGGHVAGCRGDRFRCGFASWFFLVRA